MCGLLFSNYPIETEPFRAALNLMTHRGPDAAGFSEEGACRLGHRRLQILDLDPRSNQPFVSSDNRYVMVFNGEIYNFRELAREHGIECRTESDTEVLLELYVRHGERMLEWLNGMFAFIILDRQTGSYFVARDRLGIKPLYIWQSGDRVLLSSEIAPIISLTGANTVDDMGRRQYLKMRTFFNGRTLYRDIKFFPAGHYWKDGHLQCYWSLPEGEQQPPSDEELRELVVAAVRRWKISDVPVGAYLSGGLDSTLVTGLARTDHSWTAGFADVNEFEWGRLAADAYGTDQHEILSDPESFLVAAREMIRIRQEPLSVPNEVLLYQMTQAAKPLNTVIMAGEGADELFFGYDRIFRWAAAAGEWNLNEFIEHYAYGSHEDDELVEEVITPFVERYREPLAIVAAFFQTAHLHGLLRRLDSSTMLCAVEARVPFVDHTLVERMAGVSFSWRMADGIVKAPLKRVFADVVPREIIERPKIGFPVPLDQIDFGDTPGDSPMDRWLNFNLAEVMAL